MVTPGTNKLLTMNTHPSKQKKEVGGEERGQEGGGKRGNGLGG